MTQKVISRCVAMVAALATIGCSDPDAAHTDTEAAHDHSVQAATIDLSKVDCATGEPPPPMGLMTSLPIYWELGHGIEDFARGEADLPWQRAAISQCYSIIPLDTLSPIPGLGPNDPETDPLSGLEQLAVIQPRGLSPADNVALDEWVRGGGHLLLVLDPMLTGEYDLPLGNPQRPVDSAAIPPVVKRWGMEIRYDDEQELLLREAKLDLGHVWLSMPGKIARTQTTDSSCRLRIDDAIARCRIEKGWVTLLADAASFEHSPDEVEETRAKELPLHSVLRFAFMPEIGMLENDVVTP